MVLKIGYEYMFNRIDSTVSSYAMRVTVVECNESTIAWIPVGMGYGHDSIVRMSQDAFEKEWHPVEMFNQAKQYKPDLIYPKTQIIK